MITPQRLPASLTPLDVALATILRGVQSVAPVELPLEQALRCIAAASAASMENLWPNIQSPSVGSARWPLLLGPGT